MLRTNINAAKSLIILIKIIYPYNKIAYILYLPFSLIKKL